MIAMKKKSTYIHPFQRVCGWCEQIMGMYGMGFGAANRTLHKKVVGLDGAVSVINVLSDFLLK
ncbi:hypothetical protein BACPU_21340 [Bacillus pumilus]|nr:hypothetical protein BACPU_21340 [Bacillus pumilus]